MKKSQILKCIKANKKISAYEVKFGEKNSRELFYVLKHLEINRAVKTEFATVTVYVNKSNSTGSSLIRISAADDEKSLNKKIAAAVKKASQVKNAYYPLAKKTINVKEKAPKDPDLNNIASNIAKAVFKADVYKDGWINSVEIFVSRYKHEFITSSGINHLCYSFEVQVEVIPTWSNGKEEYEVYKFYESNAINYSEITNEVNGVLLNAKDKANAKQLSEVKLPKDLPVLINGNMRDMLVHNLKDDLSYRINYMKHNHYNIGDVISDNKFDLTLKSIVKGCKKSRKYDRHGVYLKDRKIISKGIAKNNFGDIQFGYYLKKEITGEHVVCELKANGIDYKKTKHLIIDNFSSPQLEENSGYFGGEVRLARYFDGKKYIPLTRFSVSGNCYDNFKDIEFSNNVVTSIDYKGPEYFIFKGIKIF